MHDPDSPVEEIAEASNPLDRATIGKLAVAFGILLVLGIGAVLLFKPTAGPPPVEIADDSLLVEGRTLFLNRCSSCHGESGKGDGPSARLLKTGKAGNFTDGEWKYGDKPEQVLTIIAKGTPDGQMPGWDGVYSKADQRAVAAFVYHLGKRAVPESLRPPAASGTGAP